MSPPPPRPLPPPPLPLPSPSPPALLPPVSPHPRGSGHSAAAGGGEVRVGRLSISNRLVSGGTSSEAAAATAVAVLPPPPPPPWLIPPNGLDELVKVGSGEELLLGITRPTIRVAGTAVCRARRGWHGRDGSDNNSSHVGMFQFQVRFVSFRTSIRLARWCRAGQFCTIDGEKKTQSWRWTARKAGKKTARTFLL